MQILINRREFKISIAFPYVFHDPRLKVLESVRRIFTRNIIITRVVKLLFLI